MGYIKTFFDLIKDDPFMLYGFFFVLGLIIGSFLNVCIYRLPDEEKSLIRPGSHCPSCKSPIAWFDNIPLLSYLILRAKCRHCQAKISPRYFFVELVTGISFAGFIAYFGLNAVAVILFSVFCSLFVASLIDFQFKIIPDEITLYGMLAGLVVSYFFPQVHGQTNPRLGIAESVIGLLIGGGIVYGVAIIGDFIFKKESMGGGDIKLMAMIGSFLGAKVAVLTFFIAPYFAILIALYYKFVKKEATIPYGPFLSMGAVTAIFYGDKILKTIGIL